MSCIKEVKNSHILLWEQKNSSKRTENLFNSAKKKFKYIYYRGFTILFY